MKFGVCLPPDRTVNDPPSHADYIEVSASQIHAMDSSEWKQFYGNVTQNQIQTYSCNNLTSAELRLTGPDVSLNAVRNYCDELFERLSALNVKMLVFGSGKSRQVPDGFPVERAWEQLFEVGHIFATKAKSYGQTIAVEPLAYAKCNIINTVEDGVAYAQTINQENFKVLVDFYHFDRNEEPYSSLQKNRDWIAHAHFATAKNRTMPKSEDEWAFFTLCLTHLKQSGYTGHMSFEGGIFENDVFNAMFDRMKQIEKSIHA